MKKSEMILKMQRFYHIRHVMVEGGYITLEQFMTELLDYQESLGLSYVDDSGEKTMYEPEEGWDAWIAEEDRKDNLRDFQIVEGATERGQDIAGRFLKGESFEEIAEHYNVTRERIRQIVHKERRRYFRSLESKTEEQS